MRQDEFSGAMLLAWYRTGGQERDTVRKALLDFAGARNPRVRQWLVDRIQALDFSGLDGCPLWGAALLLACHGEDPLEALGQARRNVKKYRALTAESYLEERAPDLRDSERDAIASGRVLSRQKAWEWDATVSILKACARKGWASRAPDAASNA